MTTIKFLIFIFSVIIFSSFTPNSYALMCATSTLGEEYESVEYVFHGKLLNTIHPIFDHDPIATFEVLESFKGKTTNSLSIQILEDYSWTIVDGLEYIIFAYRDGNSVLWLSPCSPWFYALPTSIELVKKLTNPNSFIHDKYFGYITDSFTQTELDKIDEFDDIKGQQYYAGGLFFHDLLHFHIIRDMIVILSLVIGGTVIFIHFMRKKKN